MWFLISITKIGCLVLRPFITILISLQRPRKKLLWPVWDTNSSFRPCYIAKLVFSITSLFITFISILIFKKAVIIVLFSSLTLVFRDSINYQKQDFLASKPSSDFKILI